MLLILRKNLFPSHIVERVIKHYIAKTQTLSNTPASPPPNPTHFFKLPYVGPFSIVAQNRLRKLLKRYCNILDVKLAFSSFKIRNMFSVKDPVPVELCSKVVYKFTCASCNSCYVGETSRHLSTRIREHLNRDRTSHIFKHLQQSKPLSGPVSTLMSSSAEFYSFSLSGRLRAIGLTSRYKGTQNKSRSWAREF